MISTKHVLSGLVALTLLAGFAYGHGDVQPQPIDTGGLPPVGADWLKENPFRADKTAYEAAIEIGASGYNQNCARCHGLEVISGGIAPDLRYLEDGKFGDEWFLERIRGGYTQNGLTKMPKFEGIFSQEAMWAIRSYIETRPKE
jgi:cytochrome c-550 PedF